MIRGHGGNIFELARTLMCHPSDIIDVSSNMNALGPPPGLVGHLKKNLDVILSLPEVDSATICADLAGIMGITPSEISAGGGTTQFIYAMLPALKSRRVLILAPTYSDYADACKMHGLCPDHLIAEPKAGFQPDLEYLGSVADTYDTVVICNPNNPTGQLISGDQLKSLCRQHRRTRFVIDESYLSFVDDDQAHTLVGAGLENVIVLHSLSKIYRIPGLRVGFVIAKPPIIEAFKKYATPWSVNGLAQCAVQYLMDPASKVADFVQSSRQFINQERRRFMRKLAACPHIKPYPSHASYVLLELMDSLEAPNIAQKLARQRILIRDCSNFHGLSDQFIRISLQGVKINDRVARALMNTVGNGNNKIDSSQTALVGA